MSIGVDSASHVPVGDDQYQHLELTRHIAHHFNSHYKSKFFKMPVALPSELAWLCCFGSHAPGAVTRVMSLNDGHAKMSKSAANDMSRINLSDSTYVLVMKMCPQLF